MRWTTARKAILVPGLSSERESSKCSNKWLPDGERSDDRYMMLSLPWLMQHLQRLLYVVYTAGKYGAGGEGDFNRQRWSDKLKFPFRFVTTVAGFVSCKEANEMYRVRRKFSDKDFSS
ncbi:hypothetical protein Y032_0080g1385 [Ancylostoma ceylanicum]|uniref:Uncharacterized protein n=1 Tax=Ancylostoma ceylanicum TaxID=53326 RepID=A0A016TTU5_9BILA|nr:hypothetical protein Y032_0080g1385 [Ancylostoma ceylanicum]